ncbi:MAG: hypothetical protein IPH94_13525 [Saprospiraceae bacterium]|nr:hypothetical protein [Saprospiraceae bacterium]
MKDIQLIATVLSGIVMMLGIAVAVIWFFSKGQKKIMKARMEQKEQELNFQKELLATTIHTQETERDRIASELHDDITSQLNIIHLNLHMLKKNMGEAGNDNPLIDQIQSSLSASIERTRKLSHELMPPLLKKFGIAYVLGELETHINQIDGIQIQITSSHLIPYTGEEDQLHLYRIIQELIQNTLKYAGASLIKIMFRLEGAHFFMTYTDNGKGMDPDSTKVGSGMRNIQTRCQILKGSYQIEPSAEKTGFHIKFTFSTHG